MSYANNKGADQPAHLRSLISAFVVRFLDCIISLDSIAEISRLLLASVAVQAGLCLAWSETPEDTFCRVVANSIFASSIFVCLPTEGIEDDVILSSLASELHVFMYMNKYTGTDPQ